MNKPWIVAELGANAAMGLDKALELVRAAAAAGADAVKLQTWTPGTMCLMRDFEVSWQGKQHTLAELYAEAWLPWEWHKAIFECASMHSLTCFSSPFDKESVDFLETLDCPIYKIASFELVDLPLIKYVASKGKPMIMSCGMATLQEIDAAIHVCYKGAPAGAPKKGWLTLLKCTSAYPADASQANLATIQALWHGMAHPVGLSDHTPGIGVAIAAAALGASVIEKHFTLSRADGGLDSEFSLEPAEFKQMVVECRRAAAAIGQVQYGPSAGESTSLRRSLYWARDVKKGSTIKPEDLCTARPALGLPPSNMEKLGYGGCTVLRDVRRGEPVTMACLQVKLPAEWTA